MEQLISGLMKALGASAPFVIIAAVLAVIILP
jgi:hypothetical protein